MDAIRWITMNSATYNLDENNIGLWGTSAGAHLSMMTAFTDSKDYICQRPDT